MIPAESVALSHMTEQLAENGPSSGTAISRLLNAVCEWGGNMAAHAVSANP